MTKLDEMILDAQGILNYVNEYNNDIKKIEYFRGWLNALQSLKEDGYDLVVR